jgi:mannose-6-phosphate isomerase
LTPKHVDVPELFNILTFKEQKITVLSKQAINDREALYSSQAQEFILSVITIKKGQQYSSPVQRSIEIILCTEGNASIVDIEQGKAVALARGSSVMVPAAVKAYRIDGNATFYKASVPA